MKVSAEFWSHELPGQWRPGTGNQTTGVREPLHALGHGAKPLLVDGFVGTIFLHCGEGVVNVINPLTAIFQGDAVLLAFIQRANGFYLAFTLGAAK